VHRPQAASKELTVEDYELFFDNFDFWNWISFTGGEPFLNFRLLLKVTEKAHELKIPSTFVETNCFWSIDDKTAREKLTLLKDAGLNGILISVNPFILEYVPFERTERAIRISEKIFDENVVIYQESFRHQIETLGVEDTLSFEAYLQRVGVRTLYYMELLPMGRACYKLGDLYRRYPAQQFFGQSCREELMRDWHIHIDNYGNYITGYCGGISLGNAGDLESLRHINLDEKPILDALVTDLRKIHELAVQEFGYKELREGYVSKCHLCVDIRKHITQQTDEFEELSPVEFYRQLG